MSLITLRIQNDYVKSVVEGLFEDDSERINIQFFDYSLVNCLITSPKNEKKLEFKAGVHYYSELRDKCGVNEILRRVYGDSFSEITEPGFNVKISVDLSDYLDKKEKIANDLSLLSRYLISSPYLWAIGVSKTKNSAPPAIIKHRNGEMTYVAPYADRIIICLVFNFSDENDRMISRVIINEFKDARDGHRFKSAPQVTYSNKPPSEFEKYIKHVDNDNSMYATLFMLPIAYSSDEKAESCADNLALLRSYIRYHIRVSKVMMHTRMRNRVNSFLKILNRANALMDKTKEQKFLCEEN